MVLREGEKGGWERGLEVRSIGSVGFGAGIEGGQMGREGAAPQAMKYDVQISNFF